MSEDGRTDKARAVLGGDHQPTSLEPKSSLPATRRGEPHGADTWDEDAAWAVDGGDTLHATRAPSPLGDALRGVVEQRGWTERLRGGAVFARWEELVGPELSRRCEPVRLAGGLLVVRVESAIWAAELAYLVGEVLAGAAKAIGPGLVCDVRIVVGPVRDRARSNPTRSR